MDESLQINIDLADSSKPIYRQIADAVRVYLVSGALAPGEQLPTVRELAAELGIHYNTVAEAYRRLAAEGWLELGRRRGAKVLPKGKPAQTGPKSQERFFQRLQQLLAQGQAEGMDTAEMMEMARRILS